MNRGQVPFIRGIVTLKAENRWGSGFMKRLSRDLKDLNAGAACFSQTNLLYMKNFYCLYQSYTEITPQVEEQIEFDIIPCVPCVLWIIIFHGGHGKTRYSYPQMSDRCQTDFIPR